VGKKHFLGAMARVVETEEAIDRLNYIGGELSDR
jgi:hypothetical protein